MMKIAALSLIAGAAATKFDDLAAKQEFAQYVKNFNKQYDAADVASKFATFSANLKKIREHNAAQGETFTMAVNEFADLTADEFKALYTGYTPRNRDYARSQNAHVATTTTFADELNWNDQGAVTPVKDQGQCGSCWAFSTTGSTEGAVQIATGTLTSLAEQELVDCSKSEGNMGCNGGLMDYGFEYIIKNGGLAPEDSYPYNARDGSCKKVAPVSPISGYKDVTGGETGLMSAIAIGPVSVAIEADQSSFQFYSGGVITKNCGQQLDHGVLLVGYGTESGTDYWLVKNSWGASWGDEGYVKLERGKNMCGLASEPSYPTV